VTGLSFEFILRHDNRKPLCSDLPRQSRLERIDWIRWAPKYANGEGETSNRGVLMSNWNDWSNAAVDLLERAGYGIEWEDEWSTCDNCGGAIRIQPDSYSWQPTYFDFPDGDRLCRECVDLEDYLESIEDDPKKCCFAWAVDPAEHDYELVTGPGEFESGFHEGQNDNPETVLVNLHKRGIRRVVFRIASSGQFDVAFEAWAKIKEE
jgi:hypothetical protein